MEAKMIYASLGVIMPLLAGADYIYSKFYSGRVIGTYSLIENGKLTASPIVEIAEADLPARVVVSLNGQARGRFPPTSKGDAKFMLDFGDGKDAEYIYFKPSKPLQLRNRYVRTSKSYSLEGRQAGTWQLKLTNNSYQKWKINDVKVTIQTGNGGLIF